MRIDTAILLKEFSVFFK